MKIGNLVRMKKQRIKSLDEEKEENVLEDNLAKNLAKIIEGKYL